MKLWFLGTALVALGGTANVDANDSAGVRRRVQDSGSGGGDVNPDPGDIPEAEDNPDSGSGGGTSAGGFECFSPLASVRVLGKDAPVMAMKDLTFGDQVLVAGEHYEQVYAFAHREEAKAQEFIVLETSVMVDDGSLTTDTEEVNNTKLEITGGHLVFLEGKKHPVRADSVQMKDILMGSSATHRYEVTNISTVVRTGFYAPLTSSGNIIVDDIRASNYVALQQDDADREFVLYQGGFSTGLSHHDVAHISLSPFRIICQHSSSRMATTSEFCQARDNEEGMPTYIRVALEFATWVPQLPLFIQLLLMATVGSFSVMVYGVEHLLFASSYGSSSCAGPLLVLAGGCCFLLLAYKLAIKSSKHNKK